MSKHAAIMKARVLLDSLSISEEKKGHGKAAEEIWEVVTMLDEIAWDYKTIKAGDKVLQKGR